MKKKTLLYFKMFSRVKFRRRSNWTQTVSYTFINMHIKHHVMYLLEINSNSAGWLLSIPNSFLPSHHLPHLRETKGSILTFDFASIPVHMVRYFYGVCRAWGVKANAGSKFCVSHLLFSYLFCPAWSMYIQLLHSSDPRTPLVLSSVFLSTQGIYTRREGLLSREFQNVSMLKYNLELGMLRSKSLFLVICSLP